MEIKLSIPVIILLLGALQGFYQMVLLVTTSWNYRANRFLFFIVLIATIILLEYFFVLSGAYLKFPHLAGLTNIVMLGIGPSLYLYAKSLFNSNGFRIWHCIHYLPVVLSLIMYRNIIFMGNADKATYISMFYLGDLKFYMSVFIYTSIIVLQLSLYILFTHSWIKNNYKRLTNNISNLDLNRLKWLKLLLRILIVFTVFYLSFYVVWSLRYTYTVAVEGYLMMAICLIIFLIGYLSMKNSEIFHKPIENSAPEKYKTSALTKNLSEKHLNKLLAEMHKEEYYLDPDLTLQKLANLIDVPAHQLSQIINQELNQNFFDFINKYRVEVVKKKLLDPNLEHFSILGIATDSGFDNKVSFNRVFKKFMGQTPSEYIKQEKFNQLVSK